MFVCTSDGTRHASTNFSFPLLFSISYSEAAGTIRRRRPAGARGLGEFRGHAASVAMKVQEEMAKAAVHSDGLAM